MSFGTSGHRGSSLASKLQRRPYCRHNPGDLRIPGRRRHRRPAVPGPGHPCPVGAGVGNGAGGAGRQRDDRAGGRPGRVHADAGAFPRRAGPQSLRQTEAGADGIVVTPSHNPPADGGFKYNPPDGGPAPTDVTALIQDRANALLAGGLARSAAPRSARPGRRTTTERTTSSMPTSQTSPPPSTWRPWRRPACALAPTPSAGRASVTGAPSASAMAWT